MISTLSALKYKHHFRFGLGSLHSRKSHFEMERRPDRGGSRCAVDELWGFEAVAHVNNHLGFFHRKMGREEC
jgi:hypothetical protein